MSANGLAVNMVDERTMVPRDAGLRVITFYDVTVDEVVMRIDIKVGALQYNVAFYTSPPKEITGGERKSTDDMITPKRGGLDCMNVKVSKESLIKGLEEL